MWQPSASLSALKQRAELLTWIRSFFQNRQVLEVETPLLAAAGVTDPYVENFMTHWVANESLPLYLQTSPEYAMKRLLAAGSGPIFQLCKAFRDEAAGRFHNPEFTMLEWYRPDFSLNDLMKEVSELVSGCLNFSEIHFLTYEQAFLAYCDINPFTVDLLTLQQKSNEVASGELNLDADGCFDLLLTHVIEPALPKDSLVFLHDFPVSKAALARIASDDNGRLVAQRFELYVNGVELANGYHELADVDEQERRFNKDLEIRQQQGLESRPVDHLFMQALEAGLPDCSGVALGVDRLLMLKFGASDISEVQSFYQGAYQ